MTRADLHHIILIVDRSGSMRTASSYSKVIGTSEGEAAMAYIGEPIVIEEEPYEAPDEMPAEPEPAEPVPA